MKHNLLLFSFLLVAVFAFGQKVFITKISIEGNKKTKEKTILRELNFAFGDSLPIAEIGNIFEKNRLMMMNTNIFSGVSINAKDWDYENNRITVHITVKENWAIIPYGYADLADRNFNVWWNEKNHALNRLRFYAGLKWNNLFGYNDNLFIFTQFGFGRKFDIKYKLPNLGKKNNIGFYGNFDYNINKEIWYNTQNDSLQYFTDEKKRLQRNISGYIGASYRYKIRSTHSLKLQYNKNEIDEEVVASKNPYYLSGTTMQRYFSTEYHYSFDRRNNRFYPTAGGFFSFSAEKQGLLKTDDVNAFYLTGIWGKYFSFSEKISLETESKIRYELTRERQPYLNSRAFGYGKNYLRGYEYYVIDGTDFAYLKTSLRYRFFEKKIDAGNIVPESVRFIPVKAYFCINNDLGRVNNPYSVINNQLPNRWLWGKGIGVDVVLFYSIIAQMEYSFNHFGKGGLYLHVKTVLE